VAADLEQGPSRGLHDDAPFSFRYDGRDRGTSEGLAVERTTRQLDAQRTEHVSTYTDPKTGLVVRAVAVAYADYRWSSGRVSENASAVATPMIENLQALETQFERAGRRFVLHHATGARIHDRF